MGVPSVIAYAYRGADPLEFLSRNGAKQGDAMGTLLACCGLIPVYAEIKGGLNVRTIAIVDDCTAICPDWRDSITVLDRSLARMDITINRKKTRILWPHTEPPPQELRAACAQRQIQLVLQSAEALGAVIGRDPDHVAAHAVGKVKSYDALFKAIQHPRMPAQVATGILRVCASNRFNYITRTQQPAYIKRAAQLFDERRTDVFNSITKYPQPKYQSSSDADADEVCLDNLFGLRMSQNYSVQAYYAAAAAAACYSPDLFAHDPDNPPAFVQPLKACWEALSLQVPLAKELPRDDKGQVDDKKLLPLPEDFSTLPKFYGEMLFPPFGIKLQRNISRTLKGRRLRHVFENADMATALRIRSLSAPGALAWFRAIPSCPYTTFTDALWSEAINFARDAPLSESLSSCLCGYDLSAPDASNTHFFSCVKFRRTMVTNRHDALTRLIVNQCNAVGLSAVAEAHTTDLESGKRPDGIIYLDPVRYFDTTVRHSGSQSYLRLGQTPEAILKSAEASKTKKHGEIVAKEGAAFSPVALESYGQRGEQLDKLIQLICKQEETMHSLRAFAFNPAGFKYDLVAKISSVLMKGNALIRIRATRQYIAVSHARSRPRHLDPNLDPMDNDRRGIW